MLESTISTKDISTTVPYYNNPSEETTESDYLRDSELLGSVIFNQMLSNNKASINNNRESIRNSVNSVFDESNRPSVCFKDF